MIELLNIDCMDYMAGLPDKAFELAIVDPPYGINITKQSGFGTFKKSRLKTWDEFTPDKNYFNELFRISNNQIIWGANYFFDELKSTKCCIIWDKMNGTNDMADFELAWSSFNSPNRRFKLHHFSTDYDAKIHPTQKPVKLYRWLLHNYAKPGDRILDTHLGSGSSAIAAHSMGFDFVGCELDKDYYEAACKRFKEQTMQQKLFI